MAVTRLALGAIQPGQAVGQQRQTLRKRHQAGVACGDCQKAQQRRIGAAA